MQYINNAVIELTSMAETFAAFLNSVFYFDMIERAKLFWTQFQNCVFVILKILNKYELLVTVSGLRKKMFFFKLFSNQSCFKLLALLLRL